MRLPAVRVPNARAEELRLWLRERDGLRPGVRVAREAGSVLLPLRAATTELPDGFEVVDADFPEPREPAPASYRDLLRLPASVADDAPRAFDIVGEIVLVRLPESVVPYAREVGEALLRFVPGVRLVARDLGVHGTDRVRQLVPLAGTGGFETRHRENGVEIDVDLSKAYFSPRLGREHARVAALVRSGERFTDLCCGVGPFSLHVARDGRASSIVAVDQNADAIRLLRQSSARMGVGARLSAVVASLDVFLETSGVSDRAVLNLPLEGIKYAPSVSAMVARGGTLHYLELTRRAERADRGTELVELLKPQGEWALAEHHVVHPYAPEIDLVAWSFSRLGP